MSLFDQIHRTVQEAETTITCGLYEAIMLKADFWVRLSVSVGVDGNVRLVTNAPVSKVIEELEYEH